MSSDWTHVVRDGKTTSHARLDPEEPPEDDAGGGLAGVREPRRPRPSAPAQARERELVGAGA